MLDVFSALQHSHERGVVHRDVKPANVLLTNDNLATAQAKIADLGIARIENSSMTQTGTIMGTPAYMSPEQFMGQVVDRRTDIYSAGVLLYQMVTGERPFEGSISSIMHKVLSTEPPRPSALSTLAPAALDAVVARAMAKRPDDRFATADTFAEALRDANSVEVDEPTVIMSPAPKPPVASLHPAPPRDRSALVLFATVPLVLALIGGGIYFAGPMFASGWQTVSGGVPNTGVSKRAPVGQPDTANPGDFLATALKGALAHVEEPERSDRIREYLKATGGRALALAPQARSLIAAGDANDDAAETRALEQCQVWTNEPCALVARGSVVFRATARATGRRGRCPRSPMPAALMPGKFRRLSPSSGRARN